MPHPSELHKQNLVVLGIDEQEQGSVRDKSSLIVQVLIGLFLIIWPDPKIVSSGLDYFKLLLVFCFSLARLMFTF